MKPQKVCVLCKERFEGYGNNPQPIKRRGECCQKCNEERVIPARLRQLFINKGGKA